MHPKTRSCTRARCVCFLQHQSLPSLSPFTALGKPRQHLSATTLKPAIKALQDPYTASRSHSLARGLGNGLTTFWGRRASTHATVIFAPTVFQCLGLAGATCTSGIGSAFDFPSHFSLHKNRLGIGVAIKEPPNSLNTVHPADP
jgi:hypothetical protein